MIEVKNKHLTFKTVSNKFVNDVIVTITFNHEMDVCSFNHLLCKISCKCQSTGYEKSALVYCLYLAMCQKLCGDPLAVKNSKVAGIDACYGNDTVAFSWKMKGVLSHVRKSLGLALGSIKPSTLYSTYSSYIKILGGKPSKEVFNSNVADLISDITKGIDIVVAGNIKTTKEKNNAALDVITKKINYGVASKPQKKSEHKSKCDSLNENVVILKLQGYETFLLMDYLNTKMKGVKIKKYNKNTCVYMSPEKYKNLQPKLKQGVKDYVEKKYKKIKDIQPLLVYMGVSKLALNPKDVDKLLKLKDSEIEQVIKSAI